MTQSAAAQFEEHFLAEPNSGCWLWDGSINRGGYGQYKGLKDVSTLAHRVSWSLYRGPIPEGLWVLHRCDVRCCVRPDHLFLGTHQDNMDDMWEKGRSPRGEDHHFSVLSAQGAKAILSDTRSHLAIAMAYGVGESTVRDIKAGNSWARENSGAVDVRPTGRPRSAACRKGHPFTPENTFTDSKTGDRYCKICKRARLAYVRDQKRLMKPC